MASYKDFLYGGISSMTATVLTTPMDNIKIKIQKQKEIHKNSEAPSILKATSKISKAQGSYGFFSGMSSSLFRQATYGTARLGCYKYFYHYIQQKKGTVSLSDKTYASFAAGLLASAVGNPFDVIGMRFQTDSDLPRHKRHYFHKLREVFASVIKESGVSGLWQGMTANILKTVAINIGMLTTYDQLKEEIAREYQRDDHVTKAVAGLVAGLSTSLLSLPFDNIMVRMMSMVPNKDGSYKYSGFVDCLVKTVQKEGVTGLWVGLPAYYLERGPHILIALLMQDLLHGNILKSRDK